MTQLSFFRSLFRLPSAAAAFGLFLALLVLFPGTPVPAVGALDADQPAETAETAEPPAASEPETKTPIDYTPAAGSPARPASAHPFIGMAAKLLLVLAAVFALFWFLRRFRAPSLNAAGQEGAFGVAAFVPLTSKTRLALLRFGRKLLLISASGDRVGLLAETADPEEIETILASLRRPGTSPKGGER